MSDVKIDELFTRARAAAKEDPLLTALLDSAVAEVTAKALQIRSKADEPTAAAAAAATPTPEPQTPATPSAELTDAEADLMVAKLWPRFEAKMAERETTAVAKAAEPVTAELAVVKSDVAEVKTILKSLAGVQPAGEAYRASQAVDTIVNKAAAEPDPLAALEQASAAERKRILDFIVNGGA